MTETVLWVEYYLTLLLSKIGWQPDDQRRLFYMRFIVGWTAHHFWCAWTQSSMWLSWMAGIDRVDHVLYQSPTFALTCIKGMVGYIWLWSYLLYSQGNSSRCVYRWCNYGGWSYGISICALNQHRRRCGSVCILTPIQCYPATLSSSLKEAHITTVPMGWVFEPRGGWLGGPVLEMWLCCALCAYETSWKNRIAHYLEKWGDLGKEKTLSEYGKKLGKHWREIARSDRLKIIKNKWGNHFGGENSHSKEINNIGFAPDEG